MQIIIKTKRVKTILEIADEKDFNHLFIVDYKNDCQQFCTNVTLSNSESYYYLIVVSDDNVITGGRSIQDNLLVNVRAGSPINPKDLIMLRHTERLHSLTVLGFHAFYFQSGSVRS